MDVAMAKKTSCSFGGKSKPGYPAGRLLEMLKLIFSTAYYEP